MGQTVPITFIHDINGQEMTCLDILKSNHEALLLLHVSFTCEEATMEVSKIRQELSSSVEGYIVTLLMNIGNPFGKQNLYWAFLYHVAPTNEGLTMVSVLRHKGSHGVLHQGGEDRIGPLLDYFCNLFSEIKYNIIWDSFSSDKPFTLSNLILCFLQSNEQSPRLNTHLVRDTQLIPNQGLRGGWSAAHPGQSITGHTHTHDDLKSPINLMWMLVWKKQQQQKMSSLVRSELRLTSGPSTRLLCILELVLLFDLEVYTVAQMYNKRKNVTSCSVISCWSLDSGSLW